MGKALLLIAVGLSTIFGTMAMNLSKLGLRSVDNYIDHYKKTVARNSATSGVYMTLSKLCEADTFRTGFHELPLVNSTFSVDLQDHNDDPNLSSMELKIVSTASYEDISKSIEVRIGIPPNLADLAIFCTDTIHNVSILDESGNPDSSLAIQHAPDMLPFDKDGLIALAQSQNTPSSHIIDGDFAANNNWPNGNFYYDAGDSIPNVTWVKGHLTVGGGKDVYGIFVVEGNTTLDGNARVEGVIYMPNPGSIVIHGGGNPDDSSVTGGIFANGRIDGTGNHIDVRYKREYMEIFGAFQTMQKMYILSWKENPAS